MTNEPVEHSVTTVYRVGRWITTELPVGQQPWLWLSSKAHMTAEEARATIEDVDVNRLTQADRQYPYKVYQETIERTLTEVTL